MRRKGDDMTVLLNRMTHVVMIDGKVADIPPKPFRILEILIEAQGATVSREEIMTKGAKEGWPESDLRTVDQHIARLRKQIGKNGDKAVITVSGHGYRIADFVRFEGLKATINLGMKPSNFSEAMENLADWSGLYGSDRTIFVNEAKRIAKPFVRAR